MAKVRDFWRRFKDTDYFISINGDVLSLKTIRAKILKASLDKDGYKRVDLCFGKRGQVKHFHVHRLVAECWILNPNNYPIINHIDCNKKNNHIVNLEWCTVVHNERHALENGLKPRGELHYNSKLTAIQVNVIRDAIANGFKKTEIANYFNISRSHVGHIGARKIWASL